MPRLGRGESAKLRESYGLIRYTEEEKAAYLGGYVAGPNHRLKEIERRLEELESDGR